MKNIEYINLPDLDRNDLLKILNKNKVREHLVPHKQFDEVALDEWILDKVSIDAIKGCRVKGIEVNGVLAGWCGIQFEGGAYELAIVLDEEYWGIGVGVFKDLMVWAKELGHSIVVLHLYHTRSEYKFLRKISSKVYKTTMFGQTYTSYELCVS